MNDDLFADNSWYFRNALIRANYRNVRKEVEPDMSFLNLFFRNLMMGENHELKNGFVAPLYPNNPKHPRQNYLLTVKGLFSIQQNDIQQLIGITEFNEEQPMLQNIFHISALLLATSHYEIP